MTKQAQCFRALQQTSMCATSLAKQVGMTRENARRCCIYLVQRGVVGKYKVCHQITIYYAVIGKSVPKDRRGKPKACRNHRGAVAWAKWLKMMQDKHGPNWVYDPSKPSRHKPEHREDAWRILQAWAP